MNSETTPTTEERQVEKRGLRAGTVAWIVLGTILVTAAVTWWALRTYLYPGDFKPVRLSASEEKVLHGKLRALGYQPRSSAGPQAQGESDEQWLRPEAYREEAGKRTLYFTERELNALIANNPDLARRLAVDLSDDRLSVRALIHVDPDFPVLGGKTLRVSSGVELAYRDGRPVVRLLGVSVMGVPIPSAWLGGLKNVDLIREFGDAGGFWDAFARGVEDIQVEDGRLKVTLRE
jgi:hypothetical protein